MRRVLVVDDSKAQRLVLRKRLSRWGFTVVEAEDGLQALERLEQEHFPLIVSDWVMPKLSGPELCQKIRAAESDCFTYIILLTSKSDKEDVSAGLTAGADDFLSKPVDDGELRARLRAGLRQIELQESLQKKNVEISEAYTEVKTLYERIDLDLRAAAELQRQFIPPPYSEQNGVSLSVHYQPNGHVGGDLVGYFATDEHSLGLYAIDVSGHGVASSLLTIRLAQYFGAGSPETNIAFSRDKSGRYLLRKPAEVIGDLNDRFLSGSDNDLYFTMVYGILNLEDGSFEFCQAGHTHPLVHRSDGQLEYVGDGGPPVGLLPGVDFSNTRISLGRSDKLLLYSDGIVEATHAEGDMLGEDAFLALVEELASAPRDAFLPRLIRLVSAALETQQFEDDISVLSVQLPDVMDVTGHQRVTA